MRITVHRIETKLLEHIMTQTNHSASESIEQWEACSVQTPYDVSLTIPAESQKEMNAEFSREPYRVVRGL
jgi:hypothetical protein